MRIRTLSILVRMLKNYQKLLAVSETKASHFWISYFMKEELLSMMPLDAQLWVTKEKTMPSYKTLIDLVEGEERIVEYMITKLESGLPQQRQHLSATLVREALTQLGLHDHYLLSKKGNEYDEYDISNSMVILFKAGFVYPVWGFFNCDVEPDDIFEVTSLPPVFYDTKAEAEEMFKILTEEEYFSDSQVKILSSEYVTNQKHL